MGNSDIQILLVIFKWYMYRYPQFPKQSNPRFPAQAESI